ncbi:MAG TPA: cation-transporting P-type ATPase [Patescibacteria group bacterium]|nr:cation-transporting P-type ATPase [Patescibacteria group bacterium]
MRENPTSDQLDYYRMTPEEVLTAVRSRADGLTKREAADRLEQNGPNILSAKHKDSPLFKYLRQFKDLMILLLVASSVIAFYLGDGRTAIVLLAIVLFNTAIGFLQEFKAERVMESLEKLVVASAQVLRGGKLVEIPSSELVLGDIVYVEEGDSVPADLRTLNEEELSTNDFALTGESNPTRKFIHALSADVPLSSRQNMVFMGTTVATGRGYGIVVGTSQHTELGRIASLSQDTVKEDSPLQKEMNNIAKRVTQGTVVLCAILLPISIHGGLGIKDAFLFAIGIAASIIPQGLPAEINTALARAAGQLAKARALIKKLSAVEGLGATSVICTDKTGTLTENQMTVEQLLVSHTSYLVTGKGYEPQGIVIDTRKEPVDAATLKELDLFFTAAAMACNAHVSPPDNEHSVWYCLGDPTEGAIITLAKKVGIDNAVLDKKYPELHEFGFDSARKRMSSIRKYGPHKELHLFVKGAPESVLAQCTKIWDRGKVRKLHPADRKFLLGRNEELATQAMRNLAVAYRILPAGVKPNSLELNDAETELVWLGMVSMIDPLRPEVPDAMDAARRAHIKVSIVTGDFAPTAKAIAMRARLTEDPKDIVVVSGEELAHLSDSRVLDLAVRGGVIFSRVAPEDKLRIVGLVQESGRVVAVTGDGINDAPALKKADIGVAMGVTGTDVAKQSAEIILLDDSFHTLVGTVQQGRVVFQNIRKGTLSCFTSNSAELVVNLVGLAAATLFGLPLALSVMEILAIDLIAELFPIAALGADKADRDLMDEPPRNPKDHILNGRAITDLLWCGILIGGFAFANFLWFFHRHGVGGSSVATGSILHMKATALTYLTIVLCQLFNILQRRSQQGLFTRYQFHNKSLWLAMLLSIFCVFNIIYNPWIAPYFHASSLGLVDWLYAFGAAALFIAIREFQRFSKKHSRKAVLTLHRELRAIKN